MPRITISYRREDSEDITGRIYDRLRTHYGPDSVFRDIDKIPLGVNFRKYIDETIHETDVLLAVIGPRWLGPREGAPNRIEELNDPVRVEVAAAFRRGVTVIPLLVGRATMPSPEILPEELQELSDINGAEISSGRDFENHINGVIKSIDKTLEARTEKTGEPLPQVPRAFAPRQGVRQMTVIGILAGLIVAVATVAVVVVAHTPRPLSSLEPATAVVSTSATPAASISIVGEWHCNTGPNYDFRPDGTVVDASTSLHGTWVSASQYLYHITWSDGITADFIVYGVGQANVVKHTGKGNPYRDLGGLCAR